jgi:rubrerythrin
MSKLSPQFPASFSARIFSADGVVMISPQTIASEEELLSVAAALEAEAARRYRALARWAEQRGEKSLAELFTKLEKMEQEHESDIAGLAQKRLGHAIDLNLAREKMPQLFDDEALRSALLTPYRALSLAVRHEVQAFAFFTDVAAYATTPALRALAEDLARAELDHAAILRRFRRAAFHAEQPRAPPPASLDALRAQQKIWEAEVEAARGRLEELKALARNAERYLMIADAAKTEPLLAEAQRLAGEALKRLADRLSLWQKPENTDNGAPSLSNGK